MSAPAVAVDVPPAARFGDFPGWLPPMLVKELRQGLRAKGFVGFFIIMHALAVCVYWFTMETNVVAAGVQGTYSWLNAAFWLLLTITMLFIIPFRGLGALRTEMDSRTFDLLVLTQLTPWRIVVGKWVALMAQAALFLIAVLPYAVIRYFFGAVDFASDLFHAGLLLLGCGTITAAALWISTLPKFFRALLPIVLVLAVQGAGMGPLIGSLLSGRGVGRVSSTWWSSVGMIGLTLLVLLCLVFLGLAVRRLAAAAENHAVPARVFGLALLAGLTATAWLMPFAGRELFGFAFLATALIAGLELAQDRLPMRAHWRPWSVGWRRRIGRVFLPGWPSAVFFAAVALAWIALAGLLLPRWSNAPFGVMVWLMVQVWVALAFPALLISYLPANSSLRVGGNGYFLLHALFGTVSLLSASNSVTIMGAERLARMLDALCSVLPISSAYHTLETLPRDLSNGVIIGQAAVFAIIVVLVRRQSRAYWLHLARLDTRAAELAAPAK